MAAICQRDEPGPVLDLLREIASDPSNNANPGILDVDIILDNQGHTGLHLAASLARQRTVTALIANGADIHRGNYLGETPLIRACLATHNADQQCFNTLVASLNQSIRTLDTAKKSVLHHVTALSGVKGRAAPARYYLDQILYWIAQHQGGDFRSLVDLQDEHGDTALNIAARVGNRSLVRTLLDVNANRTLSNKLGLRPGDFGVETEVKSDVTLNFMSWLMRISRNLRVVQRLRTFWHRYEPDRSWYRKSSNGARDVGSLSWGDFRHSPQIHGGPTAVKADQLTDLV